LSRQAAEVKKRRPGTILKPAHVNICPSGENCQIGHRSPEHFLARDEKDPGSAGGTTFFLLFPARYPAAQEKIRAQDKTEIG